METFLIKALQLIMALSLLVIIHEFGHYLFARIFGIKVEKFYLFFDPWFSLLKFKPKKGKPKYNADGSEKATWRDTEYGVGWLPLGGSVKIAGMIDVSMDREQMEKPAQPWEFRSKPSWQRLLVMIAGVVFNFILAIMIYAGMVYHWGEQTIEFENAAEGLDFVPAAQAVGFQNGDIPLFADGKKINAIDRNHAIMMAEAKRVTVLRGGRDTVEIAIPSDFMLQLNKDAGFYSYRLPVYVGGLSKGDPAERAGIQKGDHFVKVGETPTPSFTEFTQALMQHASQETETELIRDGKTLKVKLTPTAQGKIGIMLTPLTDIYPVTEVRYGFFESIPKGVKTGVEILSSYVVSLKHLFSKEGAQSLGGFGAIGNLFPEQWSWRSFWEITALLSVILAFMNIIPIPALDGGHVLFLLYEIITRRKPSEKFLEHAQIAGMCLIFLLLIYANGNDIYRFIFK